MTQLSERQIKDVRSKTQIAEVVSALGNALDDNLVALVLYGSRARDDAQIESDWDLLLIGRDLPQQTFKRHIRLKTLLPPQWRGWVSILAKTPSEFEARLTSLWLDIALDGIILYDQAQYMASKLTALRDLIKAKGLRRERHQNDFIWQWDTFPGLGWSLQWEGTL